MPKPTARSLVNGQVAIECFSLGSDGRVVFVARRVRRGEYVSHLWSVPWDGGRATQLTNGRVRDTAAAISPDGTQIAFVRTPVGKEGAEGQLWVLPLRRGARPWRLTRQKHGAATPRWSPDGTRLAFLGGAGEHRFLVGPEHRKRSPLARRLTRTDFRDDDSGHVSLLDLVVDAGERERELVVREGDVREVRVDARKVLRLHVDVQLAVGTFVHGA